MRRMHDFSRLTEFFIKVGLIAALAAALLVPTTINVHGNDGTLPAALERIRNG